MDQFTSRETRGFAAEHASSSVCIFIFITFFCYLHGNFHLAQIPVLANVAGETGTNGLGRSRGSDWSITHQNPSTDEELSVYEKFRL